MIYYPRRIKGQDDKFLDVKIYFYYSDFTLLLDGEHPGLPQDQLHISNSRPDHFIATAKS